jgi:molecular chaperone HscC
LARAARCYESFLAERRDLVGQLILAFETVLERQDPKAIEASRREVEEQLNALEGERYL